MKWRKLGRIWKTRTNHSWQYAHSMMPTADHLSGDIWRIYFSGRDSCNRSLIGFFSIDLKNPRKIIEVSAEPALGIGELGCFDDNGVTPASVISLPDKKFLYYCGWKPRGTTRFGLTPGLAESKDGGLSYTRVSRAPILSLTDREPLTILTAPFVMGDVEQWHMWYVSGVKWLEPDLPRYNIKYAKSSDGINWEQTGIVCIELQNDRENALGRPCVIKDNETYRMWYSFKGGGNTYRIGYAESGDGIEWERLDHLSGIDVSKEGWDSEMITYAFVINHKNRKYMFYNGNGYGLSGIGLAVEE